ncbi:hypothetical protein FBEOM_10460 [Fusarium beomiforme]|uniref:RRM domain-containing protein n=1 Tax=Fusarium beomiforme TaxID=44412 RepID=A0A9P5DVB7_9HYPO|nr:hypothetical protein FBEOM_10460 [Fusarium beomiforme]
MPTRKRPRDVEEYGRHQGLVIYIGNIHYDAELNEFEQFLRTSGILCKILWPEAFGRSHGGWCWARFELHDHASTAINYLHGAFFRSRKLEAGLVALNAKRVRFQNASSSFHDAPEILGPPPSRRDSFTFSNEFRGFNPHTFFQSYNSYEVPTYPATSSASTRKQYHRPAEYPDFYPVSSDCAPRIASFRQDRRTLISETYQSCRIWRSDKPFLDTAAVFAKGIKISGLAITINPEQTPPEGAVPLFRPGK